MDIIVVKHSDNRYISSPFNIRFGGLKILKTKDRQRITALAAEIAAAAAPYATIDADGLDAAVKKVKGARKVETKSDDAVEFEFSAGQDVRPQVAKAVIQAGYELIEMRPIGMSLEEIFLELTQNNDTGKRS